MMVQCGCGKILDKVPSWLAGVNVEFVCTNCPNRQIKSITQVSLEQVAALKEAEANRLAAAEAPAQA